MSKEIIFFDFQVFGIEISYYVLCLIGAFVLYFMKMDFKSTQGFEVIGRINPKYKENPWCKFGEALIFSVLGAIIGTILTSPTNPQQAIVAGLCWTSLLGNKTIKDRKES